MSDLPLRPPRRPCARCPWSRATPPGEFSLEAYERLRDTVGAPGNEVPLGTKMFACHKTAEGKEQPCAGWLAAVGVYHLGVRIAIVLQRLDPETLHPQEGWPELFHDYDELVQVQAAKLRPHT